MEQEGSLSSDGSVQARPNNIKKFKCVLEPHKPKGPKHFTKHKVTEIVDHS